jgi:hypothetical protein
VLIGLDEFQPAIPWQVALQQSLPPLSRPRAILQNKTSPYNDFAANGDNLLNFVSQPKGAVHNHRPLPQTPTPARRYKGVEANSEIVSKVFVTEEGVTSSFGSNWVHYNLNQTL